MKQALLLGINGILLVVVLALAVLVDSNGRVLGLIAGVSRTVTLGVFIAAFLVAALLIGKGHGWARGLGIALVVLYVGLLLPTILP